MVRNETGYRVLLVAALAIVTLAQSGAANAHSATVTDEATVGESAREIPVAYQVDVVVVGGSTHAVAAATSAAGQGASVFLAAPRPYLGEDLVDSLSLSLPPGTEPRTDLGALIYRPVTIGLTGTEVPFRYRTDVPSSAKHRDTTPPSLLTDRQYRNAPQHSVQYDGNVKLSVELESIQSVDHVTLLAFEKQDDYGIDSVQVSGEPGCTVRERKTESTGKPWSRIEMTVPVGVLVDHLDIHVRMREGCERVLLSELILRGPEDPESQETAQPSTTYSTTPFPIKTVLDELLLDAHVPYLHGCYATELLVDADGHPAGIVMANRAGRQAVIAKMIVDTTPRATVAELAQVRTQPWPSQPVPFYRTTLRLGGAGDPLLTRHEVHLALPDAGFPALAKAEQEARDQTFAGDQVRSSAFLFHVPPDPIVGQKGASDFQPDQPIDSDHFRPQGHDRLMVLSGRADVPRSVAAELLKPCGLVAVAARLGGEIAQAVRRMPAPRRVSVRSGEQVPSRRGDIREVLRGIRSTSQASQTVPSPERGLPVLGQYDVVIIGGGTAGAAAGIGAARQGARTLVVEYQDGLGGVGTLGMIGKPYHGRAVGFGGELPFPNKEYSIEQKMEWYRRQLRSAGADIWFGVLGCGAYMEEDCVRGAVVATPTGRGVVLAHTTIDATGNADIAVAAGADWIYGANSQDIALQGTGLPTRSLEAYYTNSDYLLVDESDMLDVWRALVGAKQTMSEETFDAGTLIQTRERRRIVGDHRLSYLDQIAGRTYPDSIVFSGSDYDSHGYPTHIYFALLPHDEKSRGKNHPAPGGTCYTPYRSLLPKGLQQILVIGLGISMDRDASAMVRMQLDISNQGYAAGVATAMAAQDGQAVRKIDVRRLQRHLIDTGALPEEVLTHEDNFPLSSERVRTAIRDLAKATNPQTAAVPLAVILSHGQAAMPHLKAAYDVAAGQNRLVYARVLGMLGDPTGVDVLIEALNSVNTWDEKIYQGRMAEYAHLPTPVDSLILALGSTGDQHALEPILDKLTTLDADTTLSHHRAVALALELLGDAAGAEPLARLLNKPSMRGHVMRKIEPLHNSDRGGRRRTGPLREIVLARVLYRLGDHERLGETILRQYTHDIRGLFARHAKAVLEQSE